MIVSDDQDAIDTAWRIHDANLDWTGKAETKASFALAIESALLAGVLALTSTGERLAHLAGNWVLFFFWLGLTLIGLSLLGAGVAVFPRLEKANARKLAAQSNFIYFGHVRLLEPGELEAKLRGSEMLPVLSRQLVTTANIAWRKHRSLQFSFACVFPGAMCILAAIALK